MILWFYILSREVHFERRSNLVPGPVYSIFTRPVNGNLFSKDSGNLPAAYSGLNWQSSSCLWLPTSAPHNSPAEGSQSFTRAPTWIRKPNLWWPGEGNTSQRHLEVWEGAGEVSEWQQPLNSGTFWCSKQWDRFWVYPGAADTAVWRHKRQETNPDESGSC